jgi:hypothetical protein
MPLQKILFKPGVNRENTRYTTEGGWYDCNKVRFRQGTPEKIGGWAQISGSTYYGVCRSLWSWAKLDGTPLIGVGTNLKYYIEQGLNYYDITPIRASTILSNPFTATSGSAVVEVADTAHGAADGDFVDFTGALALSSQTCTMTVAAPCVVTFATFTPAENTAVTFSTTGNLPTGLTAGLTYYVVNSGVPGATKSNIANAPGGAPLTTTGSQSGTQSVALLSGITAELLNTTHQITYIDADTYSITLPTAATAYDTQSGGTTVNTAYEIHTGPAITTALTGWGSGGWGSGGWGVGTTSTDALRLWSASNFGQDLVYAPNGGVIYYWNAAIGVVANEVASISIATPAVVTVASAILEGTAIVFNTTGALPTGVTAGTVYYVKNVSGLTFNISATYNGTEIDTSGTQSGSIVISQRGLPITALANADGYAPSVVNFIAISDASRFTFAFGCNEIGSTEYDPMLIRWSDQESLTTWFPSITNQAGFLRLSHGSGIITSLQVRQEILVWTDSALYSLQYLGAPYVWGSQLLMDNISVVSQNAASLASGVTYWMGLDKFYRYDGRVQTLRCDLRQYIFQDINRDQFGQVFSGTNEGFNEVWWFYCSANSTIIDKYVVYNYSEDIWYYGTMARTAWSDSALNGYPVAATYSNNLVYHEYGNDNNETGTPIAINAYISSSEFDIGDGHNFGFIWRLLPDVTFRGSSVTSPAVPTVTMYMQPLQNSGSGFNNPESVGGVSNAPVAQTRAPTAIQVEEFTQQINVRVRGRQMSFKIESDQLGCQWQLGAPRMDIRKDGRRGG